jgi:hypothetical protein
MVKQLSQTKNAISKRKLKAAANALKGPKSLIPPPQNAGDEGPAKQWKQHHAYPAYYGRPDGKVWSAKVGRVLEGTITFDGYICITIDGKGVKRSRFNLSLSLSRAIREAMECDHIVPISRGGGDAWANLQELTMEQHRLKTALDNPEAGKKAGITMGVPIIARHAGTGDAIQFTSVRAAAKELEIHTTVIERSLKGLTIKVDYVFTHTPEYLAEQADLPGEMWKKAVSSWGPIPNIQASNRGRIQDTRGRRSYGNDKHGYKVFGARIDKKKRCLRVHDVITRTFHGPPPSFKHSPDHVNRDPSDNRAENAMGHSDGAE